MPLRSLSTVSNGTTVTASEIDTSDLEREPAPVRRTPRTKEEIELSNLKKKTRKRTRRFEVDGVVVTTTTSKVTLSRPRFSLSPASVLLNFWGKKHILLKLLNQPACPLHLLLLNTNPCFPIFGRSRIFN